MGFEALIKETDSFKYGQEEGKKDGLLEGILVALEIKFGLVPATLQKRLSTIDKLSVLEELKSQLISLQSLDELEQFLTTHGY